MADEEDDACLCITSDTNANRGPTDKQSDEDPMAAKLRKAIEDRCGKATPPQPSYVTDANLKVGGQV